MKKLFKGLCMALAVLATMGLVSATETSVARADNFHKCQFLKW